MPEREPQDELTPELIEHLERSSDGLPIEALVPLSQAELVDLLMVRTRLGSLVRHEITSWLSDENAANRVDDLRAYIAAGQDARDALTVHRYASRSLPSQALS